MRHAAHSKGQGVDPGCCRLCRTNEPAQSHVAPRQLFHCRYILIIPTKQLVIVRLAFNSGDDDSDALTGPFLGAVAAAVEDTDQQIAAKQVPA